MLSSSISSTTHLIVLPLPELAKLSDGLGQSVKRMGDEAQVGGALSATFRDIARLDAGERGPTTFTLRLVLCA